MSCHDVLAGPETVTTSGPLLIVSTSSGYGGAERSVEIILRHLPPEQRVCILVESPIHLAELRRMARPATRIEVVGTVDKPGFNRALQRFIALYARLRPQAVLANTETSARILAEAARWLPGLCARSHVYVRDFLWQDLPGVLARLPGAMVLVPDEAVLRRPGYLEPHVVPRGPLWAVVLPDMAELAAPPHPPPAGAPVLHLATVNLWKGHRHLIAAAALLRDADRPLPVRSIGYQHDPAQVAALTEQIATLRLQGLVSLEPYVPDPSSLLRDCLAVAVTSVSHSGGPKTFARTIIEAWAHGRPVVAFAAGAPASLVRHEQDGLLAPEGDEAALAAALRRLANDPALCERLGRAGFERVRAEFDAYGVTARLLAVLFRAAPRPVAVAPEQPDRPRVLLDLTRTLEHGWLTPMGLSRVEAEVAEALKARRVTLRLLRHDAAAGGYRPLDEAEAEWLGWRFGILTAGTAGPSRPPAWR